MKITYPRLAGAAIAAGLLMLAAPAGIPSAKAQIQGQVQGGPRGPGPQRGGAQRLDGQANDNAPAGAAARGGADGNGNGLRPLPPDSTTHQSVSVGDHTIDFSATAGSLRLLNAQSGAPIADIAYIAYVRDGSGALKRPVTFVFNGGPGYASGWLNLGGLGPWRLPMTGAADVPSAPPVVADNADTWLDFTDLVFIDPAGTGYSRILGGDDVRKQLWSVSGDVDSLATAVRRWIEANNRELSPKFIAGESYGGFRAPKIARELVTDQGMGVSGLVMISPVLDFAALNSNFSLFNYVTLLPVYAAAAREAKGPITRASVADVESYATGDYLSDLLKGVNDKAAVDRISTKVAEFTGLDPALVRRLGGRVPENVFAREFDRAQGRDSSPYDATVTALDPTPFAQGQAEDQLRVGLHAPIVELMLDLYRNRLHWIVQDGRYQFFNMQASRQWDYGRGEPEAIRDLRSDLALDPSMRVLIVHGLTDLTVPYLQTQMAIDQISDFGTPGRLKLEVYPGGHMVYMRDDSRKAMRDSARRLITGD